MKNPRIMLLATAYLGTAGAQVTQEDVRVRLQSEFHQTLYSRTYQSLVDRVDATGYFPESLTGAYTGMFPRTVGALVSLFLETGELTRSEALIAFVLKAAEINEMERIPHVIGPLVRSQDPVPAPGQVVQPEHPVALYRLDQPERFGGAQEIRGPTEPLRAVELWLSGDRCNGRLWLELAESLDGPALATAEADPTQLTPGGSWVRFPLPEPLQLVSGSHYVIRVQFTGTGVPVWWGLESGDQERFGAGHGRDTQMQAAWFENPGHVTAYALDTGGLQHVARESIPVYCNADQVDGQAHVLLAWARLALRRGPTEFEERTYPQVAKLMDRTTDWPYMTPYHPKDRPHIVLTQMGLVRNVCFEHSREGRFWDCYDLLTQSFVAAALTDMVRVAQRRGDEARVRRWTGRLRSLEAAIHDHMTRELDGKTVYLEMRLPDGGGGVPFQGLGWVNLAPIAAQWAGLDRNVLRNTVAAYRQRALFHWHGQVALAVDWLPDHPLPHAVIGKGVGWEMTYCAAEGEWERICQWLDFIQRVNTPPVYMEAVSLGPNGDTYIADPGNGEQCSWWCWGMAKVRQAVGLPPGPL